MMCLLDTLSCCPSTVALIIGVVCCLIWWIWSTRQGKLPPGPRGLPLVGYLPFLSQNGEVQLAEVSKKYGNVARVRIGAVDFVVLGDYKAVVEAFVKQTHAFIGRPKSNLLRVRNTDTGVCITDGETWKQLRKFTLCSFREFGFGDRSMEPRVLNEIDHFLELLLEFKGAPVDPTNWLGMSIANVFSIFEFGNRFEYFDPEFSNLIKLTDEAMFQFSSIALRALFPWSYKIPFLTKFTGETRMQDIRTAVEKFMLKKIEEHRMSKEENMNDFIDAFLQKRKENIQDTGSEGIFDLVCLEANLWILFIAGSKTTVTTLLWAILYMALHPKVQKKIQDEIDAVIGTNRTATTADHLPYTEAALLEIQRCGSVVPLNLEHSNPEEANLFGYTIPKDSRVVSNLWAIHHDPTLWKEPFEFNPERFLNAKGEVEKPDYLIPFSIGKHICIGESMAKMELFLYLTSILQKFNITTPDDTQLNLKSISGITRCPLPYKVCFLPRESN